jgi:hypothetical protein
MKKLLLISATTLAVITSKAQVCFSPPSDSVYTNTSGFTSIIHADFNNDGDVDIACTNDWPNAVSVFMGNGVGGFSSPVNYTTAPNSPYSPSVGDFNGDGNIDIVTADFFSGLVVLLGNGSGGFSTTSFISTGVNVKVKSTVCADFNADGNTDIVGICETIANGIVILTGNGSGGFSAPTYTSITAGPTAIASADFNADGKPDIAITEQNNLNIYIGNGTGGFLAPTAIAINGYLPEILCKDFNADSKIDIAVTGYNNNSIAILLGNGSGGFFAPTNFSTTLMPSSLGSGDFDSDGNLDLIVTERSYGFHTMNLLTGNGAGSFASPISLSTTRSVISADGVDLNSDNKHDLLILHDSSVVSVWINCNTSTGITVNEMKELQELSVYPNPSNGLFYISELPKNAVVTVYNTIGQQLSNVLLTTTEKNEINLTGHPNGIYFYEISTTNEIVKKGKLVLEP